MPKTKEGLGIAGFVLGVLSIALAASAGVVLSIVGFIFCMIQQKKSPMKLAKVGIILNIIGFVLSVTLIVLAIVLAPLLQERLAALA